VALIAGILSRVFGLLFAADMLVALLLGSFALALLGGGLLSVDAALLGNRARPQPLVEQSRLVG
jgi:hypothetical protein